MRDSARRSRRLNDEGAIIAPPSIFFVRKGDVENERRKERRKKEKFERIGFYDLSTVSVTVPKFSRTAKPVSRSKVSTEYLN